jgi:hypothetical protein
MRAVLFLTLMLAGGPAAAQTAACVAPKPPATSERPARPAPPQRPRCADSGACEQGEAAAYNKAIATFNAHARDYAKDTQVYVAKLNAYVAAAEAYAKCEVGALNAGG